MDEPAGKREIWGRHPPAPKGKMRKTEGNGTFGNRITIGKKLTDQLASLTNGTKGSRTSLRADVLVGFPGRDSAWYPEVPLTDGSKEVCCGWCVVTSFRNVCYLLVTAFVFAKRTPIELVVQNRVPIFYFSMQSCDLLYIFCNFALTHLHGYTSFHHNTLLEFLHLLFSISLHTVLKKVRALGFPIMGLLLTLYDYHLPSHQSTLSSAMKDRHQQSISSTINSFLKMPRLNTCPYTLPKNLAKRWGASLLARPSLWQTYFALVSEYIHLHSLFVVSLASRFLQNLKLIKWLGCSIPGK